MIDDVRRAKVQVKISKSEYKHYRKLAWKLYTDIWAWRLILIIARITKLLTIKKRG